ncbi:MAG: hypothetical protein J6X12_06210, partial [Paludibacteraceae bacterium]|nr:hypothetical protein [Paludibacteraceae bacterium]
CCNNYEITVRNTGTHGDWNGWAYLRAVSENDTYKVYYAADGADRLNFGFDENGTITHWWEVLGVHRDLPNQKFYIYVDEPNKRVIVS